MNILEQNTNDSKVLKSIKSKVCAAQFEYYEMVIKLLRDEDRLLEVSHFIY